MASWPHKRRPAGGQIGLTSVQGAWGPGPSITLTLMCQRDQLLGLWGLSSLARSLAFPWCHPRGCALALEVGLLPTSAWSHFSVRVLPQDDQGGPEELPGAHLQCARGRCADQGAARWVTGLGCCPAVCVGPLLCLAQAMLFWTTDLIHPRRLWFLAQEETEAQGVVVTSGVALLTGQSWVGQQSLWTGPAVP